MEDIKKIFNWAFFFSKQKTDLIIIIIQCFKGISLDNTFKIFYEKIKK